MPFTRERFASISDPERWTTNVAQRKTHVKCDFKEHKTLIRPWRQNIRFLNGEGLQNLILGIFTTKMLPKLCKSLICLVWLEMWFILSAISLINKSREPFPFIYRLLDNVNTHTRRIFQNLFNSLWNVSKRTCCFFIILSPFYSKYFDRYSHLSLTWRKFKLLKCLVLLRPLSYICSLIFRIIDRSKPFQIAFY